MPDQMPPLGHAHPEHLKESATPIKSAMQKIIGEKKPQVVIPRASLLNAKKRPVDVSKKIEGETLRSIVGTPRADENPMNILEVRRSWVYWNEYKSHFVPSLTMHEFRVYWLFRQGFEVERIAGIFNTKNLTPATAYRRVNVTLKKARFKLTKVRNPSEVALIERLVTTKVVMAPKVNFVGENITTLWTKDNPPC